MMKVSLINGSPHERGCTDTALMEVGAALGAHGVESDVFQIGRKPLRIC